ncbi:MBL fold metallo-hydrolase [Antrihabitans stalactiti]|uniref:MBL fold metallo-hydrolase n=1 Tax=Antrihabitans stalactiti TaxID=2584121 RepID=A0A848KJQ0_9NOCA|nr:MBL fold metallo-hydrolase [Antrihabitans stalactiti]NMN98341.1 MBL fold metallo-hydrolase [Antrihabitans stalactiti]
MNLDNRSPVAAPPIRATVHVGRWPDVPVGDWPEMPTGTFSPTSATLISGPTEAILIDALYLKDDVRELGDLIERTGKSLTTIFITHAHPDHFLGFGPLLERFPGAKCVAMPNVIEAMKESMELMERQWELLFGDSCVKSARLPEPIEGHTLFVDGSPVNIIEVKQADIHPTSVVHVPEIDVVVAGDAIYNEIHPMLGLSTPEEWSDWLETVALVESLNPRMIVAGHRRPDGDDYAVETMIAQTRSYIQDFAAAYEVAKDVEDLVTTMVAKYPYHGNLWSLQFSAGGALLYRETGKTAADVEPAEV